MGTKNKARNILVVSTLLLISIGPIVMFLIVKHDPHVRWKYDTGSDQTRIEIGSEGNLYFIDSSVDQPFLTAMDQNGNVLWAKVFERREHRPILRIRDDVLYVLEPGKRLTAVSTKGDMLWKTTCLSKNPDRSY